MLRGAFAGPFANPFSSVGTAFNPLSIAGLKLWIDFSDITKLYTDSAGTTPVSNDGDPIGRVVCKATGNTFVQTVTASKPTYKTNILNGRAIARYDGGDRLSLASAAQNSLTYTMCSVGKTTNIANTQVILHNGDGNINGYGLWFYSSKRHVLYGGLAFLQDGTPTTNYELWTVTRGSIATMSVNANNVTITNSGATPNVPASMSYIGGSPSGSFLSGDISELLMYDSNLTNDNLTLVTNYLNSKWGVY